MPVCPSPQLMCMFIIIILEQNFYLKFQEKAKEKKVTKINVQKHLDISL